MLGEVLSNYSGKITSVKVLPFDSSGQGVKYEVTQVGEFRGRLSCQGMGSNYVQVVADGTSTTKFYGVFTTPDGETLLMESGGMGVPLSAGRVKFRTTVTLKSTATKLAWVNTTPIAFEGEGNFSTMEVTGTLYEWK
jgi:hypothetical protein